MTTASIILGLIAALSIIAMGFAIHELRTDLNKTNRRLRDFRIEHRAQMRNR